MAWLPEEAPAKKAVREFRNTKVKELRGRQRLTSRKVEKDNSPLGITIEQALDKTQDRKEWRGLIERFSWAEQRHNS